MTSTLASLQQHAITGRVTSSAPGDFLHASAVISAARRCLVCTGPADGAECDRCTAGWDYEIERSRDL